MATVASLLSVAIGFLISLNGCADRVPRRAEHFPLPRISARVTRVIDGDTVVLGRIGHVRLIGIDTPERGEPGFEEATDFVRERVEGRTVSVEVCPITPRDPFGRARVIVYYSLADGSQVCLNRELVAERLAKIRGFRPCHINAEEWKPLEDAAHRRGTGLQGSIK